MIVVPEDIKVLESGKNRILMLLTKVKDTDKIIGYEELVSRIAQLSHLGLSYTLREITVLIPNIEVDGSNDMEKKR